MWVALQSCTAVQIGRSLWVSFSIHAVVEMKVGHLDPCCYSNYSHHNDITYAGRFVKTHYLFIAPHLRCVKLLKISFDGAHT